MFTYVDDQGTSWNKRGQVDADINLHDGSTALTPGAPVWIDTKRRQTRKAVFVDATTFRTVRFTVYTAAAFAALTGVDLTISVPGEATGVTYTLSQLIPEKQPVAKATRQLADHA